MDGIGYDRDFRLVPADGREPPASVPAAGYERVEIDERRSRVRIPRGTRLDLGATAKALAGDRAAALAGRTAGCGVLVSLGGDLSVDGPPPPGGWRVDVSDSHRRAAGPVQRVTVESGGLATSSTTLRRWVRGGVTVHHIVEPATGRSTAEVWRTVSVAAATCVDANAASTAAIVKGEAALEWLEDLRLPARLVRANGSVVRAAGWPGERGA